MTFNVGELEATLAMNADGMDTGIAEALALLQGFAREGKAKAKKAGEEISESITPDTAGAQKALDAISKTLDQQTGAVTQNTRAWAANEIGADKLKELEQLGISTRHYIDAVSGVPGALEEMEAALAGNETELAQLNRLTQQVTQSQEQFAITQRAVGTASEESTEEVSRFGDGLRGISGSVDSAIDSLQEFASSGKAAVLAAGAAIGAGLMIAIAAAMEMDGVRAKIQAALGSSTEVAARYGKVAGQVFAQNYGESMEEVGAAIVSVVRNMQGLGDTSDDVLGGIVAQVLNVSSAFEEDFNAVTRSAGQLMKTGLARNATEAMDIITAGFQSPVNAAEDLLDTIDEYSTIFRSLGLDGKDALGLLSQGLKAGARDADTVADSFKELLLRIQAGDARAAIEDLGLSFEATTSAMARGGESAKTATDTIVDSLNAVEDPATRSALAVGLFGTKAEDMQAAISGLDVDKAAQQFEDAYGKIAGSAAELDGVLGGTLQAGFDGVLRSLSDLAQQGGTLVTPFLITAADAFKMLVDAISAGLGFITDLPPGLYAVGAAVAIWATWGTITGVVSGLATALTAAAAATRGFLASMGPIGILLTAAGIAMAFLMDTTNDTQVAVEKQQTYLESLKDTLDSTTGAITAATAATIRKNAIDSGMAATLQTAGISLDLYTKAALGNVDAQEELAAAIKKQQNALTSSGGPLANFSQELEGAKITQDDLNAAIASGNWDDVRGKADSYGRTLRDMGSSSATATFSAGGLQVAIAGIAGPASALTTVLGSAGDSAKQLATDQADAAVTLGTTGDAAQDAYDKLLALATVSKMSADEIQAAGVAAGLTAPQIDAIKAAAAGASAEASPLARALSDGASAASEMDTAIQQLQLALDTLAGNEIDAEQASRAHEATIRAVAAAARDQAQAQQDVQDASEKLTEAQNNLGKSQEEGGTTAADVAAAQRDLEAAQAGVTDAADKQADSLDQLADSAQGMTARSFEGAGGMKNYDSAVAAATQTMVGQRAQFIASAVAAGVGEDAAEALADAQGLIPGNVKTSYDAIRAQEATQAAQGVGAAVDAVPDSKQVYLSIVTENMSAIAEIRRQIDAIPNSNIKKVQIETNNIVYTTASGQKAAYTGGYVGAIMGGYQNIAGMAAGGLIPGRPPADPKQDNVLALVNGKPLAVRSREFIQPQESVDYYGLGVMEAMRNRTYPKLPGYADGGGPASVGGFGGSGSVSVAAPQVDVFVTLGAEQLDARIDVRVDGKFANIRNALPRKVAQPS